MKVSVQKSVGFLRFSNFVKFAKQKEKPAQMPGFLSKFTGGSGWIRTTSVVRQQIYSLPRLSNSGARPELVSLSVIISMARHFLVRLRWSQIQAFTQEFAVLRRDTRFSALASLR